MRLRTQDLQQNNIYHCTTSWLCDFLRNYCVWLEALIVNIQFFTNQCHHTYRKIGSVLHRPPWQPLHRKCGNMWVTTAIHTLSLCPHTLLPYCRQDTHCHDFVIMNLPHTTGKQILIPYHNTGCFWPSTNVSIKTGSKIGISQTI
jgi:hypothetical protein